MTGKLSAAVSCSTVGHSSGAIGIQFRRRCPSHMAQEQLTIILFEAITPFCIDNLCLSQYREISKVD